MGHLLTHPVHLSAKSILCTCHNQLSLSVSQLGINIAVISQILQQDVFRIFPQKFGQIGLPMTLLDSSHLEDLQIPKT